MNHLKICLFNPINVVTYPPLNLTYLSSYLKKYGRYSYEIKLVDINFSDDPIEEIFNFKPDILGFTSLSSHIVGIYDISKKIRQLNKDIIQICGGVHAVINPVEILTISNVDIVVMGEGEVTFTELADAYIESNKKIDTLPLSKIDGIAYKQDGSVKINNPRQLITNLDIIPHPDRGLLNKHYFDRYYIMRGMNNDAVYMIAGSRGCPFQCIFCCVNFTGRNIVRYHSPEYITDEMEVLVSRYKAKWLFFSDDTFLIDKNRSVKLCELIIRKGLNLRIRWEVQIRSNLVSSKDLPVLKLMKRAGCEQIDYGFESGNQRVLTLIKGKDISIEDNQRAIDLTNEAGIKVLGTFILGTPTETYEELLDTKKFILKNYNKMSRFQVTCMIPYPGTRVYDIAVEKGLISANYYEELKKEKEEGLEHGLGIFCDTIPASKILEVRMELDNLSFKKVSFYNKLKWLAFNLMRNPKTALRGINWVLSRSHKSRSK